MKNGLNARETGLREIYSDFHTREGRSLQEKPLFPYVVQKV